MIAATVNAAFPAATDTPAGRTFTARDSARKATPHRTVPAPNAAATAVDIPVAEETGPTAASTATPAAVLSTPSVRNARRSGASGASVDRAVADRAVADRAVADRAVADRAVIVTGALLVRTALTPSTMRKTTCQIDARYCQVLPITA